MLFQRPAKVIRKTRTNTQHFQDLSKISDKCEIPEGKIPQTRVRPTFLASYPGSAIRLEVELVEAITGLVTSDDTFANGQRNVIAIRTFFPCPEGNVFLGAEEVSKTILFLRHPWEALPAYHDILYANDNNLKADPPPRAPLDQWISWRDTVFTKELETWRKHFSYWMERFPTKNRLIIPYEQLTNRNFGPELVFQMREFLLRENNDLSLTTPMEDIPCIWHKLMKQLGLEIDEKSQKNRQLQAHSSTKLAKESTLQQNFQFHGNEFIPRKANDISSDLSEIDIRKQQTTYRRRLQLAESTLDDLDQSRPYTERQRKEIVIVLTQLLEIYRDDQALAPILVSYVDDVTQESGKSGLS